MKEGCNTSLILQRGLHICGTKRAIHKMVHQMGTGSVGPASSQQPQDTLQRHDVESMAEELVTYHRLFSDVFVRSEQRTWSMFYMRGQLSSIVRKSIEPMVLALHGADSGTVRAVQQFLSDGAWDDRAVLA